MHNPELQYKIKVECNIYSHPIQRWIQDVGKMVCQVQWQKPPVGYLGDEVPNKLSANYTTMIVLVQQIF